MTDLVYRSIKGEPLTNDQVDTNFYNLNRDKIEWSDASPLDDPDKPVVRRDDQGHFEGKSISVSYALEIGKSNISDYNYSWYQPVVEDGSLKLGIGSLETLQEVINFNKSTISLLGGLDYTGKIKFYELSSSGTRNFSICSPNTLTETYTLTFPNNKGRTSWDVLRNDGTGILTWHDLRDLPLIKTHELRLYENPIHGDNYLSLRAPEKLDFEGRGYNFIPMIFPDHWGSYNQALTTDGNGTLTWTTMNSSVGYYIIQGDTNYPGELRLYENPANGNNYVALKAPSTIYGPNNLNQNLKFVFPNINGEIINHPQGTLTKSLILSNLIQDSSDGIMQSITEWNLISNCLEQFSILGSVTESGQLKLYERTANGNNYVSLRSRDTLPSNVVFYLPNSTGTADFVLSTEGTSGNLFWKDPTDLPLLKTREVRFYDADWSNYVGMRSIDVLPYDFYITLPGQKGVKEQVLACDDNEGKLKWIDQLKVSEDNSNAVRYVLFDSITSGIVSDINVSSSKLTFNPSTGVLYANHFNSKSDITLKNNIVGISNATDTLNNLNGVEFNWKDTDEKSAGIIAQELEKTLPHLVSTAEDGIKSVNYAGLTAYLIEAVKELSAEIQKLKSR